MSGFVNLPMTNRGVSSSTLTTLDLSTLTGWTFDSSLTGFTLGSATIKSQYPDDLCFAATFSTTVNLLYSRDGGSLTGTKTGAVTITGGCLDFGSADSFKKLSFNPYKNFPASGVGCIRMRVQWGHSGAPATNQWLFACSRTVSADNNGHKLVQITSGDFYKEALDYGNTLYNSMNVALNATTTGWTEVETNFDSVNGGGVHNAYLDAARVLNGTGTGTMNHMMDYMHLGSNTLDTATIYAKMKIRDFMVFDQMQNTGATRTTGYTLASTKYPTITSPTVKHTNGIIMSSMIGISMAYFAGGTDSAKIVFDVNGTNLYHNGAAWVASDLSASQANTVTEANAACSSLLSATSTVKVVLIFTSSDGSSAPTASSITIAYNA